MRSSRCSDQADLILIFCAPADVCSMQGKGILPSQLPLPDLPSNGQYIFHENICFDWGTFGWALKSTALDVGSYKFIVFMNSSIRGPHLPAYWPVCLLADVTWLPTPRNNQVLHADILISPIRLCISCPASCRYVNHGRLTCLLTDQSRAAFTHTVLCCWDILISGPHCCGCSLCPVLIGLD